MASKSDQAGLGPVSIPAGSFDTEALASGLDAAAKLPEDKRAGAIEDAIDSAREGDGTEVRDPALVPGHTFVDVQTPHGQERRQVYVPPVGQEKPAPEQPDAEALEKANVASVKTQVAEARKEGDVAPVPASEPLAGPAAAPAPAAASAGAGDDKN